MRQRLGQHFLRDPKVLQTILAAAELIPEDTALEIGPGKGVLTEPLAARVRTLVAVELDDHLAPALAARFQARPGVRILHEDILKADLARIFPEAEKQPVKVLGNLPYSITSPIFEKLLAWPGWRTGVFLIQKEVAQRIQATEGSRTFGLLTLAVQLFADAETIATVPPGAFTPPPDVTSAVLRLRRREAPILAAEHVPDFFDFAHGAFAHRRKTLANSLALHSGIPKPAIENWLREQGLDGRARAESVSLSQYVKIAEPWSIFRREIKLTLT